MNLPNSIKRASSKLKATKTEQELWDEVAISAMNSLMPVYWDTCSEYGGSQEMLKCHIESAFEYADEFMKQRSERLSSLKEKIMENKSITLNAIKESHEIVEKGCRFSNAEELLSSLASDSGVDLLNTSDDLNTPLKED